MWQKVSTDKFNVLLLCTWKIGFLDYRTIANETKCEATWNSFPANWTGCIQIELQILCYCFESQNWVLIYIIFNFYIGVSVNFDAINSYELHWNCKFHYYLFRGLHIDLYRYVMNILVYSPTEKFYYCPTNEFCDKVLFLHLSVSHSVHIGEGGGLPHCMLGYTPPVRSDTPLGRHPMNRHPLGRNTPLGKHPLPSNTMGHGQQVAVCILLECILVQDTFDMGQSHPNKHQFGLCFDSLERNGII